MSTFMAYGAVDLRAGVAADAFVAAFERELAREKTADHPVAVWVNDHGEHVRITLLAGWGNIWLGRVVARAAGDVERALVGLDHDEYGVEHVVFDGRGGALLRVQPGGRARRGGGALPGRRGSYGAGRAGDG